MLRSIDIPLWRNLPIQRKIAALSISSSVILVLAMVIVLGQRAVQQSGEQDVFDTAAEASTIAREIRFQVESLDLNQIAITSESGRLLNQDQYDIISRVLPSEYADTLLAVATNADRLEVLSAELGSGADLETLVTEISVIRDGVRISETRLNEMLVLVDALANPQNGANQRLNELGAQLETLSESQDNDILRSQAVLLRSIEQTLILSGDAATLAAFDAALVEYLEIFQTEVDVAVRDSTIPTVVAQYRDQAETVSELRSDLSIAQSSLIFTLDVMRDSASRLDLIMEQRFEGALGQLQTQRVRTLALNILIFTLALGLIITLLFLLGRSLTTRIQHLTSGAHRLELGDLELRIDMPGQDEFSQLARSFNAVAVQLGALIGGLEQRVAERTRDLSITGEIGHQVVSVREPRELMNQIVEMIRERFGFYHAQVFIVDDRAERANLVASTGGAGRQLLARGHYLKVGSQSVIGQVTSRGEPVVALDTDTDSVHRRNELLPDTRSEMALPMRIGERVIGALDVQSVAANAFDEDDIAVFQIIADQLAMALDNARLYNEAVSAREALVALERRSTAEAWQSFMRASDPDRPMGYEMSGTAVEPIEQQPPTTLAHAIRSGRLVTDAAGDGDLNLAIPIRVRGEVIGAFGFGGESLHDLSDDDIALVEAVVDRVGLALENLRLVEDAARRAEHESVVNEISSKIAGSTDIDYILQTTVKELGRVLRAPQTSVQLRRKVGND